MSSRRERSPMKWAIKISGFRLQNALLEFQRDKCCWFVYSIIIMWRCCNTQSSIFVVLNNVTALHHGISRIAVIALRATLADPSQSQSIFNSMTKGWVWDWKSHKSFAFALDNIPKFYYNFPFYDNEIDIRLKICESINKCRVWCPERLIFIRS